MLFCNYFNNVMWCNAAGQMLPPMVVHGAKKRPSNATHIFQSLEVSVFAPIKNKFKKRTRELEKGIWVMNLPKEHFPLIFKRVYNTCLDTLPENLKMD